MTHIDVPQTICRAGVARRDITPPVGTYHRMWGAATHEQASGVHRPLVATALVLAPADDAKDTVHAIVAIDHCLLWNDDMEVLQTAVCQATGLASPQLHIAFSHTHAAGLMDRTRKSLPGGELIGPYLDDVATKIASAIEEARKTRLPATIVYGAGRCALGKNRDFWDEASKQFVCGVNPKGVTDDTVLVARISDEAGGVVATVVNYACHPTTLAWQNTLISPDYIGAMREVVETATGAPCVFLQGASGDIGPRQGYVGDVAIADQNGRELGYAALAALESIPQPRTRFEYAGPVVSGATLGTWEYRRLPPNELAAKSRWRFRQWTVELERRPDLPDREQTENELVRWLAEGRAAKERGDEAKARDARAQVERMTRQLARLRAAPGGCGIPVDIVTAQLGDAFWVLLPGEYYNVLQRALRERFPERPIIVSTVTGGWIPGYVPPADTFGKGLYQESVAVVAPGSLEKMIETIGDQLDSWHND
jgi:hypothetical protein